MGACYNQIVDTQAPCDYHNQRVIDKADELIQKVGRNHTSAEIHGYQEKPCNNPPAIELLFAEYIGGGDGKQKIEHSTENGIYDRVSISNPDRIVFQDSLIGGGLEAHRQNTHLSGCNRLIVGKGGDHCIIEWVSDYQCKDHEESRIDYIKKSESFFLYQAHIILPFLRTCLYRSPF